jgi:hypothetical protein
MRKLLMAKEPLIHIGFPKPASKWLQRYLFQPQQDHIQLMDPFQTHAHFKIPPVLTFQPEKVQAFLKEQIGLKDVGNDKTPVITSEVLCGSPFCGGYDRKELADRLKLVFPEGKILIIIREQKAMILSLYKSVVTWGLPHSLKQFINPLNPEIVPQFNFEYLRYDRVVSYYHLLFGKERVLVLPFEKLLKEPNAFVTAIHEFSGQTDGLQEKLTRLPYNKKSNASPPITRLLMQHWVNYLFVATAFNYSGLFRDRKGPFFKCLNPLMRVSRILPEYVHQRVKTCCKSYIQSQTQGEFAESNRALETLLQIDLSSFGYEV